MPTERNCIKVDHALVGHLAQLLLEQYLIQVGGLVTLHEALHILRSSIIYWEYEQGTYTAQGFQLGSREMFFTPQWKTCPRFIHPYTIKVRIIILIP